MASIKIKLQSFSFAAIILNCIPVLEMVSRVANLVDVKKFFFSNYQHYGDIVHIIGNINNSHQI